MVDIGSFSSKVGMAGDGTPMEERTMMVEHTEGVEQKEMAESKESESGVYYGEKGLDAIRKHKDKVKVTKDVHSDHTKLADFVKAVIFENERLPNCVEPGKHPFLLSEHIMTAKSHRSAVCEVLFEGVNVPGVHLEYGGVLGLYATGRLNGLVCDMGYSQTSMVPIVEGYGVEHAAKRILFGGSSLDRYFDHLLRKSGITLHTHYQLETVRDIKEQKAECLPNGALEKLEDDEEHNCSSYEMPDGTVLKIGNARKRACEVMLHFYF